MSTPRLWSGMSRGRRAWPLVVPLVFMVAGVLFATSAETAQGTDLRAGRRLELADLIRAQELRASQVQQNVRRLRAEVDRLTTAASAETGHGAAINRRADKLEGTAGLDPVRGPGLVVTLDDARFPADGAKAPGDPSPDDLVVHQQDVQAVVNALWAGGAEAMQLMNQRVVSTSAVRCVGNTLILHGVVYSPPFTVTAVGDPDRLWSALDASPGVQVYRQYVDAYGLGYSVEQHERLRLPGYHGALGTEFAAVPEE